MKRKLLEEIAYTRHLKTRLELRGFPTELPREIFENAERRYSNGATGHRIAVKQIRLRGGTRRLMIAYDETDHGVEIVTIHPISEE